MATTAAKQLLDKHANILQTYGLIRSDCIDLSGIIGRLLLKLSNLPQALHTDLKHSATLEQRQSEEPYKKSLRLIASHSAAIKKHLETLQSKLANHINVIDKHAARHMEDQAVLSYGITRFSANLEIDKAATSTAYHNIPVRIKDAKYYADRAIQHIKFIEEHLARLIGELEKLKESAKNPSLEVPVKEIDYFCEEFALEFATCALISKVIQERIEQLDKMSFKTPLEKELDTTLQRERESLLDTSPVGDSPFIVDSRRVDSAVKT